jgi:hypothetical protein
MSSEGRKAIYTAMLSILDRARHMSCGMKAIELRYHLWLEFVRLVATSAATMDFIREAQLAYEHICARHLYPPADIFYPGDSDYTHRVIATEMRGHV